MSDAVDENQQGIAKDQANSSTARGGEGVGGGLLVITGAKLWFMVGGALISFGLPYLFNWAGRDGAALYGQYSDINNTLSILSMMIITGGLQAVSKWTSQYAGDLDRAQGAVWQLWWFMVLIGIVVGGGFSLAAPWIAEARGVAELTPAYQAAGGVLAAYSLYVVFIGALNGRRQFTSQALYDIGFTTLKVLCILGAVGLGFGVTGAFTGFSIAATLIMILAWIKVGLGPQGAPSPWRQVYGYAAQVMAYTLIFNLIFKVDLLMLKPAAHQLLGGGEDQLIGIYNLALQVSRLPWQVTIAVTFVIFPLLSEATFSQDDTRSKLYVRQTLRYMLILAGAASAGLLALPQTVTALFPESYAEMSIALRWTAPAYLCFTLFNLCNTLLMSAGRALSAFVIGSLTVLCTIAAYWFMLYHGEMKSGSMSSGELLSTAGQVALSSFALGLSMGLFRLRQLFGASLPLWTGFRVLCASTVLWGIGQQVTSSNRIVLLATLAGLGILFFIILLLLGEWSREERASLIQGLQRRLGRSGSTAE